MFTNSEKPKKPKTIYEWSFKLSILKMNDETSDEINSDQQEVSFDFSVNIIIFY